MRLFKGKTEDGYLQNFTCALTKVLTIVISKFHKNVLFRFSNKIVKEIIIKECFVNTNGFNKFYFEKKC